MDKHKRHVAEGWHEKASNHLRIAQEHLKNGVHFSDAVQAAQVCVELSVKAILTYLEVDFSKVHGWDKDKLEHIAKQIRGRQLPEKIEKSHSHIRLPRLLFLANFWEQIYLQAKYGMEAGYLGSAQDLFGREEAEIAVKHAEECERTAHWVRFLPYDQTEALLKKET